MSEHNFSPSKPLDRRIIVITAILASGNLSICLHRSSRVYLLQQSQCLEFYSYHDAAKIGADSMVDERLCKIKDVQSVLSVLEGVDGFCAVLPGLLVLSIYQKLLPFVGLRSLFAFNLVLSAFEVAFSTLFFSLHQSWTTTGILLTSIFEIIGGGDIIRIILCCTCIAEMIPADQLTKCYNYITAVYLIGSVSASFIGSLLLSHHVYLLNLLSLVCFALTILGTFLLPVSTGRQSSTPKALSDSTTDILLSSPSSSRSSSPHTPQKRPSQRTSILTTSLTSFRHSFSALETLFSVPQPTFTILSIYFLIGLAFRVEVLLPQYISLRLHWSLATVNAALALKAFVAAAVLLALPTVRTRWLEPRYITALRIDFTITRASLLAFSVGLFSIGFPLPAVIFVSVLCLYTVGIGARDSIATFGRHTLPEGENANDFFTRIGVCDSIAGMIGAPLWSAVLNVVLRKGEGGLGLPFWSAGLLFAVGVMWMRRLKPWANGPGG